MGKAVWSPSALSDIDAIAEYIARDSADHAALLIARLRRAADRLMDFPRRGRIIPELDDPSCREVIEGPYRLMYRVEGDDVWITGVVHGARDWRAQ